MPRLPLSFRLLSPALLALALLKGCPGEAPVEQFEEVKATPGITVRSIPVHEGKSHVRVIDVDLTEPGVRVEIAADDIARREGRVTGAAWSLPDWLERTGAVAGINGGFFGEAVGTDHREIVGLLKVDGRVRSAAPTYQARGGDTRYSRAALGIHGDGTPRMGWVTSRPGDPQSLRHHDQPEVAGRGEAWTAEDALACGPRLIRDGKTEITFRGERLASPGALPRTFIGYGGKGDAVQRMVLCAATGMEFEECALFLQRYFKEAHGMECREGMAMDGGSSTQAAWREGGEVKTDSPLNIEVPTAVLVYKK